MQFGSRCPFKMGGHTVHSRNCSEQPSIHFGEPQSALAMETASVKYIDKRHPHAAAF
jgi:hypothetical protein